VAERSWLWEYELGSQVWFPIQKRMDVRFLYVISFRIADLKISSQYEQPEDFTNIPAEAHTLQHPLKWQYLYYWSHTWFSAFTRTSFSVPLPKYFYIRQGMRNLWHAWMTRHMKWFAWHISVLNVPLHDHVSTMEKVPKTCSFFAGPV